MIKTPINRKYHRYFTRFLPVAVFVFCSLFFTLSAQSFASRKVFQAGMEAMKQKNYYSARLLFQEILHKDHMGEYSDDAQYYIALSYYYEEDYPSALFELKVFLRDYPMSPFLARAEYWIGESYYYMKEYRPALESHYQYIHKYPENRLAPYAYYTIGYIYILEKRFDDAIAEYDKALEYYPASKIAPRMALQLGICHYNNKNFISARRQFQRMLVTLPDSSVLEEAQLWIGKSYYAEEKFDDAKREFEYLLEKYPGNDVAADATYHLALIAFKHDQFAVSLENLEKITENYPGWERVSLAYFRKGQILMLQKNYKMASNALKKVAEGDPGFEFYTDALELLADSYHKSGQTDQALNIYDQLLGNFEIQGESEVVVLFKKGNLLYEQGDYRRSAMAFQTLYERYPASERAPEAMLMRAQNMYRLQMYDTALGVLAQLLKAYPRSSVIADIYFLQGEIYYHLANYTLALQYYNKVIRFHKEHNRYFDAMMGVGWSYFELEQYARASDWFRKTQGSARDDQDRAFVKMAIASCLFNLRDFEKSIGYYRDVVENTPGEETAGEALFQIAWVYYRMEDFEKAGEVFTEYLVAFPEGKRKPETLYFSGWARFKVQDYQGAYDKFRETYEKSPQGNIFREKGLLESGKVLSVEEKYPDAVAVYLTFLEQYPESVSIEEVYYKLSEAYLKNSQPEKVEHLYGIAKGKMPDSIYLQEMLRQLGYYYQKTGKFKKADQAFRMVTENSTTPDEKVEAELVRVRLFEQAGDVKEAVKIIDQLVSTNTEDLLPFYGRIVSEGVRILLEAGKPDQAIELVRSVSPKIENDPAQKGEFTLMEGKIYLEQGEYEKMRALLVPLLKKPAFSIAARYHLALAYYREQKVIEASDYFRQVVQGEQEFYAAWSYYYLGEILFEKGDYLLAAREFTKIVFLYSGMADLYEKGVYKAALSFARAENYNEFINYRERLRESFPESVMLKELDSIVIPEQELPE